MKRIPLMAATVLVASIELASAAEFEAMGKAIGAVLGGTQGVKKRSIQSGKNKVDVFYTKPGGKVGRLAFVEKGIYEPNCTHTWVVGIDGATGKVTQVRVVEMSCPHAFPTKAPSFLDQYVGKGPADAAKLDSAIMPIAKATGSCNLTTDAVKRSIVAAAKLKGQL